MGIYWKLIHKYKYLFWIILVVLSTFSLHGQGFPPNNPYGNTTFPGGPGGLNRPGGQNDFFQPDSLSDSLQRPKIKPETRIIDRKLMFVHKDFNPRVQVHFDKVHYWDEIDEQEGFTQSLGQIGKPSQTFYHGFTNQFFKRDFWANPVIGNYNPYVLNPEAQVSYLDTRTPYVKANYTQGQQEVQLIDITASQNITPFWNTVIFFKRKQAVGVYRNFVTDHYNLYASNYFHTKNDRYHLFFNGTFNELSDEMHGGVPRANDESRWVEEDGVRIIHDEFNAYRSSFFKARREPVLSEARGKKIAKGLYADQYYHLFGVGDSSKGSHKLTLRNSVYLESFYQRFVDSRIDTSILKNNYIPIYPTLGDSNYISEAFRTTLFKILGEASYSLELKDDIQFNLNGGINYQRLILNRDTFNLRQNITDQRVEASLDFPWLSAKAEIKQRFSNLFSAEREISLGGEFFPILTKKAFRRKEPKNKADSVFTPIPVHTSVDSSQHSRHPLLSVSFQYDAKDLNPTLFQRYYTGRGTNTYRSNPDLNNQQLNHLAAGISYRPPATIIGKDTFLNNYYSLTSFLSNASHMIHYSDSMDVLQAGDGEGLTRIGVDLSFRQRFLKHFYVESTIGVQRGSTQGGEFLKLYARSMPAVYGKTSIYLDRRNIKVAKHLRIGVDMYYNTSYVGQTVDPVTGSFFPSRYLIPSYPRMDAFFVLHPPRSHTYVWFKYMHLNEWFPRQGYYTTPFYPMLERTFTLGVNWTFYD